MTNAVNIVTEFSEALDANVEHRQSDMWKITNWIATEFPEYRLFLESHTLDGADLVLHAVPETRCLR